MHSTLVRAQNVFGFFTTVAFSVATIIALSVFLSPQNPSAKLQMRNVQVVKGRPHYYSSKREEFAHVRFDLDMDLSSLYNWNTKQVFVYITAKYPSETPSEPMTEAVIWDAILPSLSEPWHHNQYIHFKPTPSSSSRRAKQKKPSTETPGMLKLKNQKPKYVITDSTGKIAERANATLELNWNVQPWVGALTWTNKRNYGFWKGLKGGITKTFEFPALKKKEGESAGGAKKEDLATEKGAEANKEGVFF